MDTNQDTMDVNEFNQLKNEVGKLTKMMNDIRISKTHQQLNKSAFKKNKTIVIDFNNYGKYFDNDSVLTKEMTKDWGSFYKTVCSFTNYIYNTPIKEEREGGWNYDIKRLLRKTRTDIIVDFIKDFNYIPDDENPSYKWRFILINYICHKLNMEVTKVNHESYENGVLLQNEDKLKSVELTSCDTKYKFTEHIDEHKNATYKAYHN